MLQFDAGALMFEGQRVEGREALIPAGEERFVLLSVSCRETWALRQTFAVRRGQVVAPPDDLADSRKRNGILGWDRYDGVSVSRFNRIVRELAREP